MADINSAFVKAVFDVSERQRKKDIHHHGKLDDLRRRFEIEKWVIGHRPSVEQGG